MGGGYPGQSVEKIDREGRKITAVYAGGERLEADSMVWTAPLTTLNAMLGIKDVDLEYLLPFSTLRMASRRGWTISGRISAVMRFSRA